MQEDPATFDPLAEAQKAAQGDAESVRNNSAAAPLESSPSEIDRLVEEQMLAQLAEAQTVEPAPAGNSVGIREPELNFPQSPPSALTAQTVEFPQLKEAHATTETRNFDLLLDVRLPVAIELGRTTMPIADILNLGSGSIVELDKLAGEPVDLLVNNKIIAQGEVVVVDENFGIRITSLVSPQERIKSL